ncbi:hypothetical protein BGP79_00135 [Tersicoccus sp. Bi-70]|nr:hypothetical protein BGP79_00135 [Tersicoccus sp. Bi-70]
MHRGLPSPWLTFIISFGEPVPTAPAAALVGTAGATAYDVLVGRLHTSPAYIDQPSAQSGIQVAVHPLAARRLFGVPAADLVSLTEDGEAVLGGVVRGWRERLGAEPDAHRRLTLLAGWLAERQAATTAATPARPEVAEAWRLLAASGGRLSTTELASRVYLSGRRLTTLFDRELGCSPTTAARVVRFDRAVGIIRDAAVGGIPNLSAAAATAGYADHPHLDREFSRFAGCSPTAWLREEFRNIQAGGHRNGVE